MVHREVKVDSAIVRQEALTVLHTVADLTSQNLLLVSDSGPSREPTRKGDIFGLQDFFELMDSVVLELDLLQNIIFFLLLHLELVEHFIRKVGQLVVYLFGLLEFLLKLLHPLLHVLLVVVGVLLLPDLQIHYPLFRLLDFRVELLNLLALVLEFSLYLLDIHPILLDDLLLHYVLRLY